MGLQIDLVIFDCDGVLVDSEMISAAVLTGMLIEVGFPMTDVIFREDFLGRSFASAAERVAARHGWQLPDGFQLRYRERLLARMQRELRPMPGVERMLRGIRKPYCLATSSSPPRLALSLAVTGLSAYFEGRSFTASEVANGKPAPDLFLHAAARMGASPERCLVIEDSDMGIEAATAARMPVWRFIGGSHAKAHGVSPVREGQGPDIADMAALAKALEALG